MKDDNIIPFVARNVSWYRHALRSEKNLRRLRAYALLICDELEEALANPENEYPMTPPDRDPTVREAIAV